MLSQRYHYNTLPNILPDGKDLNIILVEGEYFFNSALNTPETGKGFLTVTKIAEDIYHQKVIFINGNIYQRIINTVSSPLIGAWNQNYNGNWLILGDSIQDPNGAIGTTPKQNLYIAQRAISKLGGNIVVNIAKSGAYIGYESTGLDTITYIGQVHRLMQMFTPLNQPVGVTVHSGFYPTLPALLGTGEKIGTPIDGIYIAIGTNNAGNVSGSVPFSNDSVQYTAFNFNSMVKFYNQPSYTASANYEFLVGLSLLKLFFGATTQIFVQGILNRGLQGDYYLSSTNTSALYAEYNLSEASKLVGANYFDIRSKGAISPFLDTPSLFIDNLHPTEVGAEIISDTIFKYLKNNYINNQERI